jgi:hypothetical protein
VPTTSADQLIRGVTRTSKWGSVMVVAMANSFFL